MNLSRATTTCSLPAPFSLSRPRCWQPHVRPCSSRNRVITFTSDSTGVLSRRMTLVYARLVEVRTCPTSIVAKLLRAGDVVLVWDSGYLVVRTLSHPGNFREVARFQHDAHRVSTTSTRALATHLLTSMICFSCRRTPTAQSESVQARDITRGATPSHTSM